MGHENTDFFEFNVVLVVEGQSEVKAMAIMTDVLAIDIVERGIKIITVGGTENTTTRILELLEFLKGSGTKLYLCLKTTLQLKTNIFNQDRTESI
jgi:hypothetical protein